MADFKSKDNPENDGEDDLLGGRTGDFQILDELQQEPWPVDASTPHVDITFSSLVYEITLHIIHPTHCVGRVK